MKKKKIDSKRITGLKVTRKIQNLLEDNVGEI